jgi:predicted DNA-binding transcriptional regulator AlpA
VNPEELLRIFDAWEEPMRGYDTWPHRVALEPLYVPLLAERRTHRAPIDDARKPGLWERITTSVKPASVPEQKELERKPEERIGIRDIVELQLLVPKEFTAKPELARRWLVSLASLGHRVAFEVIGEHKKAIAQIACEAAARSAVLDSLRAYFPETRVRQRSEDLLSTWAAYEGWGAVLHLGLRDRVFNALENDGRADADSLIEIVGRLASLAEGELGLVQILFEPAVGGWSDDLIQFGRSIDDVDRTLPRIEAKFREPIFAVVARVAALASTQERAVDLAASLAVGLSISTRSETNALCLVGQNQHPFDIETLDLLDRETRRSGMILSLSELATLAHLPSAVVRAEHLIRQATRTRSAPASALGNELILGINEHEGEERTVGLTTENRLRHTYCIGASGTGKSTLLLSMACQDIDAGRGFAVLDPHGDLIEDILARIPTGRASDVVVFDPSDEAYPVGFNVLSAHSDVERTILASDLVGVFRRFSTTFGDQMASVLGNAILAFLESNQGGTLLDLRHFLLDKEFRARFLESVQDDEVVYYWQREFPLLKGSPQASILTRLNTFLRPKTIRYMVAQREDRLSLRRIMDDKKILLAKLSHGAIGEENAYLLGSLLVARIAQAAMSRQDEDASRRVPFFLYMDEFQHFMTPSIAAILSGARKYGLGLVLSHQEIRQLKSRSDEVLSAVLGNAYTRIVFRVGEHDAKTLADGFSYFEARDLQNLGIGEAIARIERPDFDFNLRTSSPSVVRDDVAEARRKAVRAASREQYAAPREEIDAALRLSRGDQSPFDVDQRTSRSRAKEPTPSVTVDSEDPQGATASLPGRGGSQHKYLQSLIKKMAEDRGFVVTLEKTVLDGHGHVDALLERHGVRIGCEISVSTRLEHEVGNLTKCLAAGFDFGVLLSTDESLLVDARREFAESESRLRFLSPGVFTAFLAELDADSELTDSATVPRKRRSKAEEQPTTPEALAGRKFLTAKDAASLMGLANQTLAKYRVTGESPPYLKIGRKIVYDREELETWMAERRRRSTSDPG